MSRNTGKLSKIWHVHYLASQNLKIIQRNYACNYGEIDIILLDKHLHEDIYYSEVRYRKNDLYGHPLESINYKKKQRLHKAAMNFLQKHKQFSKIQYRFDAVTILGTAKNSQHYQLEWFKILSVVKYLLRQH